MLTDTFTLYDQGALDSLGKTVDAEFYGTFWSLQAAFSNPPQAGIEWSETARAVKIVLERLKKDPVTLTEAASGTVGDLPFPQPWGPWPAGFMCSSGRLINRFATRHARLSCENPYLSAKRRAEGIVHSYHSPS